MARGFNLAAAANGGGAMMRLPTSMLRSFIFAAWPHGYPSDPGTARNVGSLEATRGPQSPQQPPKSSAHKVGSAAFGPFWEMTVLRARFASASRDQPQVLTKWLE
jgi:hypothetical protein